MKSLIEKKIVKFNILKDFNTKNQKKSKILSDLNKNKLIFLVKDTNKHKSKSISRNIINYKKKKKILNYSKSSINFESDNISIKRNNEEITYRYYKHPCLNISLSKKQKNLDIYTKQKKKNIQYSIFINISNLQKQKDDVQKSVLNSEINNFIYTPVHSKKMLSSCRSSSTNNIHKFKNNGGTSYRSNNKYKIQNSITKKKIYNSIDKKYNKNNINSIILLQSFIRKFLLRNKIYKRIVLFYEIEASFIHINKYIQKYLKKRDIFKNIISKLKKIKNKKYLVNKEQYELIKELEKKNVKNFNDFKNFIIYSVNNNITEI